VSGSKAATATAFNDREAIRIEDKQTQNRMREVKNKPHDAGRSSIGRGDLAAIVFQDPLRGARRASEDGRV